MVRRFAAVVLALTVAACGARSGLDEASADRLEWILDQQRLKCIRVDRAKLGDSCEAWIHVRLSAEPGHQVPLEGLKEGALLEAVLTWPNSD